jgi:hypothetical protein
MTNSTEPKALLVWEIINPSDAYTIEAPDFRTAAAAVLVLGEGKYGLRPEDEDEGESMPLFLFGGHEGFLATHFGGEDGLGEFIRDNPGPLADAFDSVLLGRFDRRRDYKAALAAIDDPVKREQFRDAWHDNRSSLNDIGGRARDIARHLRGRAGTTEAEATSSAG